MSSVPLRAACACAVVATLLTGTGCATRTATRDLFYATGGCLIGTGAIGGVTVGTSVLYDPKARTDDGAFVPVADQEGQSLWPWGVGIAVFGLLGGGALLVAGGLVALDDEPSPTASLERSSSSSWSSSSWSPDVVAASVPVGAPSSDE